MGRLKVRSMDTRGGQFTTGHQRFLCDIEVVRPFRLENLGVNPLICAELRLHEVLLRGPLATISPRSLPGGSNT